MKFHELDGFKPWLHSKYIKSLSRVQRADLAKEIAKYVKAFGAWRRE